MNSDRIHECTLLAEEILKNIELSEIPMKNITYKGLRLCRLLGNEEGIDLFVAESSGYELTQIGRLTVKAWEITKLAGRRYNNKDPESKKYMENAFTETIGEMEENIAVSRERLRVAYDPDISLSSNNPYGQAAPHGNTNERSYITNLVTTQTAHLEKVKGSLYNYILNIYHGLRYGNVVEDIFTLYRERTNRQLMEICPEAIGKFISVYDNMNSDNPEDWANAVHSCRRILKAVADVLYPPSDVPIEIDGRMIIIDEDRYINRLIQYISSHSDSDKFKMVVGSDLKSIGERIDSIYEAVCKGTHSELDKEDAQVFILHTYFLLGDILRLMQ